MKYLELMDRLEGVKVRTLEHIPAAAGLPLEPATTGYCQPSVALQRDPGRELYAERSRCLAGLFMPPALPWEDLPEQDRNRWRGYAAALG